MIESNGKGMEACGLDQHAVGSRVGVCTGQGAEPHVRVQALGQVLVICRGALCRSRRGMDTPGLDILESSGLPTDPSRSDGDGPSAHASRPALQVYFKCANVYTRVLRSADGSRYQVRCPKCAKEMRFAVGEGGTPQRFFQVSC
jgi:hypothetical protein